MTGLRFRGQYSEAIASELDAILASLRAWLTVDHNEDGTHHVPVLPESIPVGSMVMWGSDTAPTHWLMCDGTAVSRTTYRGLFEVIGTSYGSGDGSTSFNLPDFRQRFPLGKATSGTGATLGSTGGTVDHSHTFSGGSTTANGGFSVSTSAAGGGSTSTENTNGDVVAAGADVSVATTGHSHTIGDHAHSVTVSDHVHTFSGGSSTTSNPPFAVVNMIILSGV